MAKLPDIRNIRGVPRLHSPKAAALPGELRKLEAKVDVARAITQTTDNLLEAEAKLESRTRLNTAKRNYQTSMQSIVQQYHDEDRDLDNFTNEMRQLHQQISTDAGADASARVNKYLRPELDNLWTQNHANELKIHRDLVTSRSLLQLDLRQTRDLELMREPGGYEMYEEHLGAMREDLMLIRDAKGITQEQHNKALAQATANYTQEAIQQAADNGDLAFLLNIRQGQYFTSLSVNEQTTLNRQIDIAVDKEIATRTREISAAVELGHLDYESAVKLVQEEFDEIEGLVAQEYFDSRYEKAMVQMTTDYITGLIAQSSNSEKGKEVIELARRELQDPTKYRYLESPARMLAAVNRAAAARDTATLRRAQWEAAQERAKKMAGEEYDDAPMLELQRLYEEGGLTEAQMQSIEIMQQEEQVYDRFSTQISQFRDLPLTEIQRIRNSWDTLAAVEGEPYTVTMDARRIGMAAADRHIEGRQAANFGDYALQESAAARDSWSNVLESLEPAQGAAAPDFEAVRGAYEGYKSVMQTEADRLGVYNPTNMPYLPTKQSHFAPFAGAFNLGQASREQTLAAANQMISAFGRQDAIQIASGMSKDARAPYVVGLAAINRPDAAVDVMNGIARLASEAVDNGDINKAFNLQTNELDRSMDWNIYGTEFGDEVRSVVLAMAVGLTSQEQLESGQLDEQAVKTAYETIVGPEPFQLGAQNTVSYRQDVGNQGEWKWADPSHMQYKKYRLRVEPGFAESLGLTPYNAAGERTGWRATDLFERAAFKPIGGSQYAVVSGDAMGGKFYTKDEDGNLQLMIVDFERIPMDNQRFDTWRRTTRVYDPGRVEEVEGP